MEFKEHVTARLNRISQTGNKRLICLHKIQEQKVLPIGKLYIVECTRTLFLIYINDLPYRIYHNARMVMYADDANALITAKNINELQTKPKTPPVCMREWFLVND